MTNLSFFGLEVAPNKEEPTPIPPGIILHVSQATMSKDGKDGEVSRLFACIEDEETDSEDESAPPKRIKREFAVATLVGKSKEAQSLELNFSEIDGDVSFKVVGGHVPVHLAGYYNQVGSEEDMFAGDAEFDEEIDDEDAPANFQFYGGDSDEDENEDGEFKPNESALNASNDSGYVINESDEDEDDEEDINAKLAELRSQMEAQEKASKNKKRKNDAAEEKPAKKTKTATKSIPVETPKKAEESPKKKQPAQQQQQQTPAKNNNKQQQQSAKKSGKKNKKNKNKK